MFHLNIRNFNLSSIFPSLSPPAPPSPTIPIYRPPVPVTSTSTSSITHPAWGSELKSEDDEPVEVIPIMRMTRQRTRSLEVQEVKTPVDTEMKTAMKTRREIAEEKRENKAAKKRAHAEAEKTAEAIRVVQRQRVQEENKFERAQLLERKERLHGDNAMEPEPVVPKRTYRKTSNEDRMWIIDMFYIQQLPVEDIMKAIAGTGREISKGAVYKIIRTFQREKRYHKKKSPGKQKIYTQEMKNTIANIQNEHHDWTYNQIRAELKHTHHWDLRPSNYTIQNALKEADFTTKQLEHEEPQRNTPAAIEYRKEFATRVLSENFEHGTKYQVFIDEQGFDLHRTRRRGRSIRGMKAVIKTPKSQGSHWSVCAAINEEFGVMHYEVTLGGYDGAGFLKFMGNLLKHHAFRNHSYIFVMDNGPSHLKKELAEFLETGSAVRHKLRFNPPYSPQLNAIEYCFSSWAAYVRRYEKTPENLRTLIKEATESTTKDKIEGWVRLVNRNLVACRDGIPLDYPMNYH